MFSSTPFVRILAGLAGFCRPFKRNGPFKRSLIDFCNATHIDVGLNVNTIDQKQKVYDVLLGEYRSGNTNPQIVKQLKTLIVKGIKNNEIPIEQGLQILKKTTPGNSLESTQDIKKIYYLR